MGTTAMLMFTLSMLQMRKATHVIPTVFTLGAASSTIRDTRDTNAIDADDAAVATAVLGRLQPRLGDRLLLVADFGCGGAMAAVGTTGFSRSSPSWASKTQTATAALASILSSHSQTALTGVSTQA